MADEETSADWADRLLRFDTATHEGTRAQWPTSAPPFIAAANIERHHHRRGQHVDEGDVGIVRRGGAVVAPSAVAPSLRDGDGSLVSRVRHRLRREYGVKNVEALVRQASPSTLAALHNEPQRPCAVLLAYYDACPYSRATEDGLVALAARMYRRNLAATRSAAPPFVVMLYDTRATGNRSFARDSLRASPVPKLFTVDPHACAVIPWAGAPMGDVRPSATRSGEWTRSLPEQALMDSLARIADRQQQHGTVHLRQA